ncbi:MAG: hypothetical protein ABW252_21970 [Polyangiales bacterium]
MLSHRISRILAVGSALLGACSAEGHSATQTDDELRQEISSNDSVAPPAADVTPGSTDVAPTQGAVNRGGRGGTSTTPIEYDDPDLKCYLLRAFESVENREGKYRVPSTRDLYVGFNIKAPWTTTQYIRSVRSHVDNKAILHHWLLYKQGTGIPEAILEATNGAHPGGTLLYGWAPGTDDLWLDPDVGMEVTPGTVFQVENHYNNLTGKPLLDASGVEICVTPHKPEKLAAMSFVGTDAIRGTVATGTCTPKITEPVNIIMSFPHMHKKGVRLKVDWTHADGSSETVHDEPFNFDYQRTYNHPNFAVKPGDKLTTTCTYDSPARFGQGTDDEMCYFFALHWPAGALANPNIFAQLHGPATCIDMPTLPALPASATP